MPSIADILMAQGQIAAQKRGTFGTLLGGAVEAAGSAPLRVDAMRKAEQDRQRLIAMDTLKQKEAQANIDTAGFALGQGRASAARTALVGQFLEAPDVFSNDTGVNYAAASKFAQDNGLSVPTSELAAFHQSWAKAKQESRSKVGTTETFTRTPDGTFAGTRFDEAGTPYTRILPAGETPLSYDASKGVIIVKSDDIVLNVPSLLGAGSTVSPPQPPASLPSRLNLPPTPPGALPRGGIGVSVPQGSFGVPTMGGSNTGAGTPPPPAMPPVGTTTPAPAMLPPGVIYQGQGKPTTYGRPFSATVDGQSNVPITPGTDGKFYAGGRVVDASRIRMTPAASTILAGMTIAAPESSLTADRPDPKDPASNKPDARTGQTPNSIYAGAMGVLQTGKLVNPSRGGGPVSRAAINAIQNKAGAIAAEAGMTPGEYQATFAANKGSLTAFQKSMDTAQSAIDKADLDFSGLEASMAKSKQFDTGSPMLNKPWRAFLTDVAGDTSMADIRARVQSVSNEYARLISQQNLSNVLSDSARKEAEGLLSQNATVGQLIAAGQALRQEGSNRIISMGTQMGRIRDRMSQGGRSGAGISNDQFEAILSGKGKGK